MIVISRKINDFLEQAIGFVGRQNQFDEAFKSHGREVVRRQSQLENVAVKNQGGLLAVIVLGYQALEALDQLNQNGARLGRFSIGAVSRQLCQQTVLSAEMHVRETNILNLRHLCPFVIIEPGRNYLLD